MKKRNYIVVPIIAIFIALLGFSTVSADRGASANRGEESSNRGQDSSNRDNVNSRFEEDESEETKIVETDSRTEFSRSTVEDDKNDRTSSRSNVKEKKEIEPLEGVDVDQPDTVPNGVFWKKIGQKLSLILTFGEVKDTAKKLEFAEENMLLAEFILENSSDDDDQENAAKLIDVANEYLSEINDKTADWLDNGPSSENAKLVVSNLLVHLDNKVSLMSNMSFLVDLKIDELSIALGEGADVAAEAKTDATELAKEYDVVPDLFVIKPEVLAILKLDQDGDGLLDTKETEIGTDIQDSDTDGDGLEDGFEFHHLGTDPLKADTDGDGYADATEIKKGFSPWQTDTPLLDGEVLSKIQKSYESFNDDSGINSHVTDLKKIYSDIDLGKTDFIETNKLDLELDLDFKVGQPKF